MNSIKWFNINYLFQNLKKSKAVLAIFLVIVPLLSTLTLIIASQDSNDFVNLEFNNLSTCAIVGMYIIPIIVSISLFGFVFKRKSSDFINSMPLNRSTIFVTNSIGGILLLTAMILISTLLILVTSYLLPEIVISRNMMIDYFFIWTVTYIFVFTAANLAASISGNTITTLAVTALLVFLFPFLNQSFHGFSTYKVAEVNCTDSSCTPVSYNCYNDKECLANQDKGIYKGNINYNMENQYNVPYHYISNIYSHYNDMNIAPFQLVKMFLLSIIYFALGLFLFRKKAMEVTETSFKNIHFHNVIKCLTIIPMVIFVAYNLFNGDVSFAIFALALVFVYYLVFDLITKKRIDHIIIQLIYFVIAVILITGYYRVFTQKGIDIKTTINANDIKEISLNADKGHADTSNIYMDDKGLKNLVVRNLTSNYEDFSDYTTERITANIKMSSGKIYNVKIDNIPTEDYNQIMNVAYNNTKFAESFKNVDYKHVYAISSSYVIIDPSKNKEVMDMIKAGLANTNVSNYNELNKGFDIVLFAYKNHKQQQYAVNSSISSELTRYISKYTNELLKKKINSKKGDSTELNSIGILSGITENDNINYYLIERSYKEIFDFIKNNINRSCDITKEYLALSLVYDNKNYVFYTNNTDGFNKILEEKANELKDTPEYKQILEQSKGEDLG